MKNLLFILAIIISSFSFAQGNLQFNQVVNLSYSGTGTGKINVGSLAVPAGKVWKITSASATRSNTLLQQIALFVGDHIVFANYSAYYSNFQAVPLWLSEGIYDVHMWTNNDGPRLGSISVLEFNVVP